MNKEHLVFLVIFPSIAGTIFGLVAAIYDSGFQSALIFAGLGFFMAFCLGLQGIPMKVSPVVTIPSHRRGIERKMDFLRNHWKESPVGLVVWILLGSAVGSIMLSGLLFALVDWMLGVSDPLSSPIFNRPYEGPYDHFVFILSGVLFAWMVFIPLSAWIDRLDAPKESELTGRSGDKGGF